MGQYLGPGLLGLGVTAMIAGFMSGMAGNVSAFATVWTYDVYRPLFEPQRQRPPLPDHGPLVLDPGRADLHRHGLRALLLLQHPRIPPGAGLLLHRAAVRRGDPGHALEAGHARPAGSGASWPPSSSRWACGSSSTRSPTATARSPRSCSDDGAVVQRGTKKTDGGREKITRVIVESGTVKTTNVPVPEAGQLRSEPTDQTRSARDRAARHGRRRRGKRNPVRLLAPEVVPADTQRDGQVRRRGRAGRARPGVKVEADERRPVLQPGRVQPRPHQVHRPLREGQAHGGQHVQRLLDADGVPGGDRRREPVHEAQARRGTEGPGDGPDAAARRRPLPLVSAPMLWAAVVAAVLVAVNIIFW